MTAYCITEIPKRELVLRLPSMYSELNIGARLDLLHLQYSFQWRKRDRWLKAMVMNDLFLRQNISLHTVRNHGRVWRPEIKNAGWHCSYCMSPEHIREKLMSFAHANDLEMKAEFKELGWIQHCIKDGWDIMNRSKSYGDHTLIRYHGGEGYPLCLKCNMYAEQFFGGVKYLELNSLRSRQRLRNHEKKIAT